MPRYRLAASYSLFNVSPSNSSMTTVRWGNRKLESFRKRDEKQFWNSPGTRSFKVLMRTMVAVMEVAADKIAAGDGKDSCEKPSTFSSVFFFFGPS